MSKYVLKDGSIATVTHTMADGSVRDSVKGYEVPVNEQTAIAYGIMASWLKRAAEAEAKSRKDCPAI